MNEESITMAFSYQGDMLMEHDDLYVSCFWSLIIYF